MQAEHLKRLADYFRPILSILAAHPSAIINVIINAIQPHYIAIGNGNELMISTRGAMPIYTRGGSLSVYLVSAEILLVTKLGITEVHDFRDNYRKIVHPNDEANFQQAKVELPTITATMERAVLSDNEKYYMITKHAEYKLVHLMSYTDIVYTQVVSRNSTMYLVYSCDKIDIPNGSLCEIMYIESSTKRIVRVGGITYPVVNNLDSYDSVVYVCDHTKSHKIYLQYPYCAIHTVIFNNMWLKDIIDTHISIK